MDLDQKLSIKKAGEWKPQVVAVCDLLHLPPDALVSVVNDETTAPGILAVLKGFDFLLFRSPEEARDAAVEHLRQRVLRQGLLALERPASPYLPVTDAVILEHLNLDLMVKELRLYAYRQAETYPDDFLRMDVPEYDAEDLADMTAEQTAKVQAAREKCVSKAIQAAYKKVESDPMDYLRCVSSPNNPQGNVVHHRVTKLGFRAKEFCQCLVDRHGPKAVFSRNLDPLELRDTQGSLIGLALDFTP